MPRELNDTAPLTNIGRYTVSINNHGCLHIVTAGTQLQLSREESRQLITFLINNSTESAGEPSTHE
jgi:hypothetical protein